MQLRSRITHVREQVTPYKVAEVCFLAVFGCYIAYLAQGSTTFLFKVPAWTESALFAGLAVTATIKCAILLWERKDELKRWLILVASAAVVGVAYLLAFRSVEYPFLKFLAVITIGMVGTDYYKPLKVHVCIMGAIVGAAILAALCGVIQNLVYLNNGHIRSAWGLCYPTDYASSIFFLCVMAWVAWKRVPNAVFGALAVLSCLNAAFIARSRTSLMCSALMVLAIICWWALRKWKNKIPAGLFARIKSITSWAVTLAFPAFAVLMVGGMLAYVKGFSFAYRLDYVFSGRLRLAAEAYKTHGFSWFGTPFDMVGSGFSTFARSGYNFVDSSYPLIFIRYGAVLFVVVAVLWVLMARKATKLGDWRLALGLTIIAFHCVSEHHMLDVNYNEFIVLPFAVLAATTLPRVEQAKEQVQNRKVLLGLRLEYLAGLLTAAILVCVLLVAGPHVLQLARTAWDVLVGVKIKGKLKLTFVALTLVVLALLVAGYGMYQIVLAVLRRKRPQTRSIVALAGSVGFFAIALLGCNMVISQFESRFTDTVNADRGAIEAVKAAISQSGGKLYSNEVPGLYSQTYGGMSSSFFDGEDLARLNNVTVLMDANYESQCFIGRGFLYAQISDAHALYTNDKAAIQALENEGFHLTGYYSKSKTLNLKQLAKLNNLPLTPDGAIELNGEERSLVHGTGLELRSGTYTVTYDLCIPKEEMEERASKDYTIASVRVSTDWGANVVKKQPVNRSQFDADGKAVVEVEFSTDEVQGAEFLMFAENGYKVEVQGITYAKTPDYDTHTEYDNRGRKIRETFFDLDGNPYQMKDRSYGCVYEYDTYNNMNHITYLDANGNIAPLNAGYAQVQKEFNAKRQVVRERYLDAQGNPTTLPAGYAVVKYAYDDKDHQSDIQYFDESDQKILLPQNYARVKKTYDDKDRVIREEYFGVDDKPILSSSGCATLEHEYDEDGNETLQRLLGEDGKPAAGTEGYASVRKQYDAYHRLMRESYYGADEMPIALLGGYSIVVNTYDATGNKTDVSYYDVEGKPTMAWNTYARIHYSYDDKGRAIAERYFDENEKPITRAEGYAVLKRVYNEQDDPILIMYADTNGSIVMRKDGFAQMRLTFNNSHLVIYSEYLNIQGMSCRQSNGTASMTYEYDAAGNQIRIRYYGLDRNIISNTSGYAEVRKEYDEYKHVVRESYFDVNGNSVNCIDGYAVKVNEYDAMGKIVETTRYTKEGNQVE